MAGILALARLERDASFLLLAIFIGIFVGMLIVCFHITIDYVRWLTLGIVKILVAWICFSAGTKGIVGRAGTC